MGCDVPFARVVCGFATAAVRLGVTSGDSLTESGHSDDDMTMKHIALVPYGK
jgi:hypothetical protein